MNILVTGGLGFMGSNFIRHMLQTRPDVRVLNFDKMTYAGNPENLSDVEKNSRYSFVRGDIADQAAVERAVQDFHPDAIINYAAETHVDRSILEPEAFIRTDVLGTFHLLDVTRTKNIPRFIQISTDEVYGSVETGESSEKSPFDPSSPYAASKAGADHLVRAYARTYGTPAIITHACNNFGPFQYPEKLIPLFITNLLEEKKIPVYGTGMNVREWIYVLDHAKAIAFLLEKGEPGSVYNIGTGERKTNIEITTMLLDGLGKDESSIEYVKDRPGHDTRYALDATRLRTAGWAPETSFDDGIAQTIAWYRDHRSWWDRIKSGEFASYYKSQYGKEQARS